MNEKSEKEGTLKWYLEMSDEEFEEEMDKFGEWLEDEEKREQ